ncbi:MAG: hydroxymethylbilane synthase [Firmicutes bacterium]|nr:hydroxymethylbilane synthase [Bacillota bacterium]
MPLRTTPKRMIRVGTRQSALAMAQTASVVDALRAAWPTLEITLVPMISEGDTTARPFGEIAGEGLFTSRLEQALLDETIDVAVHSLKDLPTQLAGGLTIFAFPPRADAADLLVGLPERRLGAGCRIGTSSPRRASLLQASYPGVQILPLRGNVETRLKRLQQGACDATVLAAAGIGRLGLEVEGERLSPQHFIPAVGQGILAIEGREEKALQELFAPLDDKPTRRAALAERAFLRRMGGGCKTPMGAYARQAGDGLTLDAFVAEEDGSQLIRIRQSGIGEPAELGRQAAEHLLKKRDGNA